MTSEHQTKGTNRMKILKDFLNRIVNWIWKKFVGVPLQGHPEDEEPRP